MSHGILPSRMLAGALVVLVAIGGSAVLLHAQDVPATPAAGQGRVTPASGELTGRTGVTPAPTPVAQAGPRLSPPLERYEADLPGRDRAESSAAVARGGRHTIVLSTLALVLIVVIVVLLVVD